MRFGNGDGRDKTPHIFGDGPGGRAECEADGDGSLRRGDKVFLCGNRSRCSRSATERLVCHLPTATPPKYQQLLQQRGRGWMDSRIAVVATWRQLSAYVQRIAEPKDAMLSKLQFRASHSSDGHQRISSCEVGKIGIISYFESKYQRFIRWVERQALPLIYRILGWYFTPTQATQYCKPYIA